MANRWDDHYAHRAKREGWLARSVYKLEEIDRKHRLIRTGSRILDLGCSPGSWSQYCLKRVGTRGRVVGIDLQGTGDLVDPRFRFIQGDIRSLGPSWLEGEIGRVDALISDLAPKTSGTPSADASRSLELAEGALALALVLTRSGGAFLCKVFEGEDLNAFRKRMKGHFKRVRTLRPSAVRKGSREVYLLGLDRVKP